MDEPQALNQKAVLRPADIRSVSTEIAAPTLPVTIGLLEAWQRAIPESGGLPHWRKFSPGALGELMPFVYVLERDDAPDAFRIRFMGSAIARSIGADYTGAVISKQNEHASSWRADVYEAVLSRKAPMFTAVDLGDFKRDFVRTECVLLPVCDDSGLAQKVVCAAAPYPAAE